MYKLRYHISALTVLFIFLFGSLKTYIQSDIPYFYYYSRDDDAFIVERADGTERSILTSYTLSETYLGQWTIDGDGWSPSGELFTWIAHPSEGGHPYAKEVFLFQRNNSQLHTLSTDDNEGIASVQWSPTDDLLLITSYTSSDVVMPIVSVYNTVEQAFLFRYTSPALPNTIDKVSWSPDGRFIAIMGQNTLVVISIETTEVINYEGEFTTLPMWLSDTSLVYPRSSNELVILNLASQAEQLISIETQTIQKIDWSPDENHALVFVTSPDFDTSQLYMLSRTDQTTKFVAENLAFASDSIASHWSNDSQYAYFVSDNGELNIIANFSNVYTLPQLDASEIRTDAHFEWENENQLLFTMYIPSHHQSELFQLDASTFELWNLSEEIFSTPRPIYNFSVEDKLLFLQGFFVNLDNHELLDIIPSNELRIDPVRTDESIWHPSGQALFLLSRFNALYYVKVGHIDRTTVSISHEIALCPLNSKACFGWMPNS